MINEEEKQEELMRELKNFVSEVRKLSDVGFIEKDKLPSSKFLETKCAKYFIEIAYEDYHIIPIQELLAELVIEPYFAYPNLSDLFEQFSEFTKNENPDEVEGEDEDDVSKITTVLSKKEFLDARFFTQNYYHRRHPFLKPSEVTEIIYDVFCSDNIIDTERILMWLCYDLNDPIKSLYRLFTTFSTFEKRNNSVNLPIKLEIEGTKLISFFTNSLPRKMKVESEEDNIISKISSLKNSNNEEEKGFVVEYERFINSEIGEKMVKEYGNFITRKVDSQNMPLFQFVVYDDERRMYQLNSANPFLPRLGTCGLISAYYMKKISEILLMSSNHDDHYLSVQKIQQMINSFEDQKMENRRKMFDQIMQSFVKLFRSSFDTSKNEEEKEEEEEEYISIEKNLVFQILDRNMKKLSRECTEKEIEVMKKKSKNHYVLRNRIQKEILPNRLTLDLNHKRIEMKDVDEKKIKIEYFRHALKENVVKLTKRVKNMKTKNNHYHTQVKLLEKCKELSRKKRLLLLNNEDDEDFDTTITTDDVFFIKKEHIDEFGMRSEYDDVAMFRQLQKTDDEFLIDLILFDSTTNGSEVVCLNQNENSQLCIPQHIREKHIIYFVDRDLYDKSQTVIQFDTPHLFWDDDDDDNNISSYEYITKKTKRHEWKINMINQKNDSESINSSKTMYLESNKEIFEILLKRVVWEVQLGIRKFIALQWMMNSSTHWFPVFIRRRRLEKNANLEVFITDNFHGKRMAGEIIRKKDEKLFTSELYEKVIQKIDNCYRNYMIEEEEEEENKMSRFWEELEGKYGKKYEDGKNIILQLLENDKKGGRKEEEEEFVMDLEKRKNMHKVLQLLGKFVEEKTLQTFEELRVENEMLRKRIRELEKQQKQ